MALIGESLEGRERFNPPTTNINQGTRYKSSSVGAKEAGTTWSNLAQLMQLGSKVVPIVDEHLTNRGEERSDHIIRSMSAEQRRAAVADGTLLYKDDPYTMKALNYKSGRAAAFEIDDKVSQMIARGEIKTREDLDRIRHEFLQETTSKYAEAYGLDARNKDYLKGYDSDITQRNISLYGQHDKYMSDRMMKTSLEQVKIDTNSFLSDNTFLRNPNSPQAFMDYIKGSVDDNLLPSDELTSQAISDFLNKATQKEGGSAFLKGIKDKTINLYGSEVTIGDLITEEGFNNLIMKADTAEYTLNAGRYEQFALSISEALANPDRQKGWETIQQIKSKNNFYQPSEAMTTQRGMLIQAEQQLISLMAQDTARGNAKILTDAQNKVKGTLIRTVYSQAIKNGDISTALNTIKGYMGGEDLKEQDIAKAAVEIFDEIDAMPDLNDQQKNELKLAHALVDENGVFEKHIGAMVNRAEGEFKAAVLNGNTDNLKIFEKVRGLYQTNPQLMAQMFPTQVGTFALMDTLDSYGLDYSVLLENIKASNTRPREIQVDSSRDFQETINSSAFKDWGYLDDGTQQLSKLVWDNIYLATRDRTLASAQTVKFLEDNVVQFNDGSNLIFSGGKTTGTVPKAALMVNERKDSWEIGKQFIDEARKNITASTGIDASSLFLKYDHNSKVISIYDAYNTRFASFSKANLESMYKDKVVTEAKEEAIKREETIKQLQRQVIEREAYNMGVIKALSGQNKSTLTPEERQQGLINLYTNKR